MTPSEAAQKLDVFREAVLADFRPVAEVIYPLVVDEIQKTFTTEGRSSWRPLSAGYARRKQITHPGKTILRRDDHYFNAATVISHPAHVKQVDHESLTVGVNGGWFQRRVGFNYPDKHEGDRPVYRLIGQRQAFRQRLENAVASHLKSEIRKILI
jgi:hypothetical protein